ncbi:hypothetical protein [Pseudobacteriovorax antillogorgiicola]|uniref:Uncharacterized protein n=1 Tax=Pseudobacteriovorax antillogorgiicola TaxID=1513793 RepID=A0A1Y6CHL4_9BACT|nr:hypothetical protein [Pseudobacteriovorax antillogorgiicola]TCS47308.1 hypothetical protein EDD56_12183 [Pseudobacteriovorax antillogorgiicola]SMF62624.1 hypothetical protein SAMN06296036_12183 [Pseudobacteriovorax antillogorgiicola]
MKVTTTAFWIIATNGFWLGCKSSSKQASPDPELNSQQRLVYAPKKAPLWPSCEDAQADQLHFPCPDDRSFLCRYRDDKAVCWVIHNPARQEFCTAERGRGFGTALPCSGEQGGFCAWNDRNYQKACTPIYHASEHIYCFTNGGKGYDTNKSCQGSPELPCRQWALKQDVTCLATTAANDLPYCIERKGFGQGNPFPCNRSHGLLCALRERSKPRDWCVIRNQ